jgi:hypothetical protein
MNNTIRNYSNSVILNFEHCGNNFSLDVPHYNKWISIIRFLKKRGFSISENETYKKHYKCLSKYHKIGFKKEVALLMEINASSIKVEFGNIQNLWKGLAQSFWDNQNDDRYTKLSYLQNLAVKLEIKKLLQYCEKYNLVFAKEYKELSPEQFIINKLKVNRHIHGEIDCLNDIKNSITTESYDWKHNSNDKNKKKIVCGETKYFYDYHTKRLSCGVVWHNINNMWWVICNGKLLNIASFELFDYEKSLPKRKAVNENYISRLLKTYESKRDYKRCIAIQQYHKLQVVSAT